MSTDKESPDKVRARYAKLVNMLKNTALGPEETANARQRIREMEERYPELNQPERPEPPRNFIETLITDHILRPAAQAAGVVVTDFIRGASQVAPEQEPTVRKGTKGQTPEKSAPDTVTPFLAELRQLAAHDSKLAEYLALHSFTEPAVDAIDERVSELIEAIDPDQDVRWDDLTSVVAAVGGYLRRTGKDPHEGLMVEATVRVPFWACLPIEKKGIESASGILGELILELIHSSAFGDDEEDDDEEEEEEEDAGDEDSGE